MRRSLAVVLFTTGFMIGCLSVHRTLSSVATSSSTPLIEAGVRVDGMPEKLSQIMTVPENATLPPEKEAQAIRKAMDTVEKQIHDATTTRLSEKLGLPLAWDTGIMNQKVAQHQAIAPPLKLEITLSGYGRLKRKWVTYMLVSGAVEAVFQGVVVASALNNTWAGLAVGGEEMTSEWITWHGGAWLFSRTFSPVTLEGHLWRTKGHKLVWRKIVFVSKNKKEMKTVPEKDRERREIRLQANLHKAENLLLTNLSDYLFKQGVARRNAPLSAASRADTPKHHPAHSGSTGS